jgi:hypothetical protein
LLCGKGLGLLRQEGGERALGQAASGGRGDLLEGHEVEVGAGARLVQDATGDDFSPTSGEILDLLEFLSGEGVL